MEVEAKVVNLPSYNEEKISSQSNRV